MVIAYNIIIPIHMSSIFVRPRDTRHRPDKHRRKVKFSLKNLNWKLILRLVIIISTIV